MIDVILCCYYCSCWSNDNLIKIHERVEAFDKLHEQRRAECNAVFKREGFKCAVPIAIFTAIAGFGK